MTAIIETLSAKVTDLESAASASNAKIDAAIAELGQLKTLLDAAIASTGLSSADAAALQAVADKVSAVTSGLQAKTQALADAEAINAPTN